MALYHFSLGHIKRTAGHTAIAAAAYRAGEKIYDAYYGETQDYRWHAETEISQR